MKGGGKQIASTGPIHWDRASQVKGKNCMDMQLCFLIPGSGLSYQKVCLWRWSHGLGQSRTQQTIQLLLI